jgi:hypothetical protein
MKYGILINNKLPLIIDEVLKNSAPKPSTPLALLTVA